MTTRTESLALDTIAHLRESLEGADLLLFDWLMADYRASLELMESRQADRIGMLEPRIRPPAQTYPAEPGKVMVELREGQDLGQALEAIELDRPLSDIEHIEQQRELRSELPPVVEPAEYISTEKSGENITTDPASETLEQRVLYLHPDCNGESSYIQSALGPRFRGTKIGEIRAILDKHGLAYRQTKPIGAAIKPIVPIKTGAIAKLDAEDLRRMDEAQARLKTASSAERRWVDIPGLVAGLELPPLGGLEASDVASMVAAMAAGKAPEHHAYPRSPLEKLLKERGPAWGHVAAAMMQLPYPMHRSEFSRLLLARLKKENP